MKPDIKKRLEAILDDRQKQKAAVARQLSEREKTEEKNLADFAETKERVIKPALQEIADLYKRKGLAAEVVDEPEEPNERGGIRPPSVALDLAGETHSYGGMNPLFKLTFDKSNRRVSLFTTTRSMSGGAGEVSLDSINADWIHDAFLKYESGPLR